MKNRNSVLDLWRFIASIPIVLTHSHVLGMERGTFSFSTGWMFVEFFFMITGYFTMKHFSGTNNNSVEEKSKNAITYTIKKFSVYIPYAVIAIMSETLIDFFLSGGTKLFLIENMILELTLCVSGKLGNMWFLSALFIVFPFFCCLCQINKYSLFIIASLYVVIYYNAVRYFVLPYTEIPYHLLRALAGLLLGVMIYLISEILKQIKVSKKEKILLTIVEQVMLLYTLYSTYINRQTFLLIVLCYFVALTILFSNLSYSSGIHIKFFEFLGKLSLVIYLMHYTVFSYFYLLKLEIPHKRVYALIMALLVSLFVYVLVESIRKRIKIKKIQKIKF